MREIILGFLAGALLVGVAGAIALRRAPASASALDDPSAAAPDAPSPERQELETRLSSLRSRLGEGASEDVFYDPNRPPTDRDVSKWLMAALAGEGPMTRGEGEAEDWINGALEWLADERGQNQADLEFGPLRERFLVELLEKRGAALDEEQKKEFARFLAEAEAAYAKHLAETAGKPDEERLISGLQTTKDWEDKLAVILKPEQFAKIGDLGVLLDQWRWLPACEPKLIDPQDPEAALESAREKLNPGDYDRSRPILVEHVKALVAMHREVGLKRMEDLHAVSDVDEFIKYMEIRIATRKRLVEEAGLRVEAIPPQFLMDYMGPPEEQDQ
ncbi:MAG: hypothetical protein AAB074_17725 [Planctomycetota bacterium]